MTKIIRENKGKMLFSVILVIIIFFVALSLKDDSQAQKAEKEKKAVAVSVRSAGEAKNLRNRVKYPATVSGEQEITVTSATSGIATAVNFDLGDAVGAGKLLVRIDDQGGALGAGESGFRNGQIQQLELAKKQAEEAYDLAKDTHKEIDTDASKAARDIAKLQLESAQVALGSALDSHLIKAPIPGTITSRGVSAGDSVSPGQLLATISRTDKLKIQFYVGNGQLQNLKLGASVEVESEGKKLSAKIINISPAADSVTRKFLVEAVPAGNDDLSAGMIVNVAFDAEQKAESDDALILPLSAVNISQNETSIFILDGDKSRKVPAVISSVFGETAQIKADISPDSLIIVEGNKMIADGERVEVK